MGFDIVLVCRSGATRMGFCDVVCESFLDQRIQCKIQESKSILGLVPGTQVRIADPICQLRYLRLRSCTPCLHDPRKDGSHASRKQQAKLRLGMDGQINSCMSSGFSTLDQKEVKSRMIILSSFHVCWDTPKKYQTWKHHNSEFPPGGCPKAPAASALEITTDK